MNSESNDFERYKSAKSKLSLTYKGYPINKLISSYLIRITYNSTNPYEFKFSRLIYYFIYSFSANRLIEILKLENIYSRLFPDRVDYENLIEGYRQKQKEHSDIIDFDFVTDRKINLINVITSFFQILTRLYGSFKLIELIYLAAILCHFKNQIDRLESINDCKTKKYYAFNSAYGYDTLMTLYFQKQGILTYGLQHAVYFDYKSYIPFDVINYENFCSEYFLAWSESSIEILAEYGLDPKNGVVFGHPLYVDGSINTLDSFENPLLLLPRGIYDMSSSQLLNELVNTNFQGKFGLKPHPTSNIDLSEFEDKVELVSNDISLDKLLKSGNYDCSITFNSSVFYQSWYFGIPSFLYSPGENEKFGFESLKFSNIDEFKLLTENHRLFSTSDLNSLRKDIIHFAFGVKR